MFLSPFAPLAFPFPVLLLRCRGWECGPAEKDCPLVLPCIIGRTKLRITHLIAGRGRRPLDGIFVAVICVVSARGSISATKGPGLSSSGPLLCPLPRSTPILLECGRSLGEPPRCHSPFLMYTRSPKSLILYIRNP